MTNLFRHLLLLIPLIILSGCKDNSPVIADSGFTSDYEISYHCWTDQNWEIYLNKLSGSSPQNISNFKYEDSDNSWSPDGKFLTYTHFFMDNEKQNDIYIYNLQNKETVNLTPGNEYYAFGPDWTPDSKNILFNYNKIPDGNKTYIMKADGSGMRKLLDFGADLFFYPDSYNFLYSPSVQDGTGLNIYKTNIDRSYNELILDTRNISSDYTTVFDLNSKNNELLILASNNPDSSNFIIRYNISSQKIDTLLKAEKNYWVTLPRYSHDFTKIVYYEYDKNYNYRLYILDLFNKQRSLLFNLPVSEGYPHHIPPVFSPNDKFIAFVKNVTQPGQWYFWKTYLYVVEISSKNIQFIDVADCPVWNPKANY